MGAAAIRVLSFHATYRCRHSGACCTSNWPIPVEADRAERIRGAMATGALRPAHAVPPFASGDGNLVLSIVGGQCAFFDERGGRLCHIQRALGHDALPLACRQFPRVAVRDPRGVSVTLSHYCPTAAAMLDSDGPVMIAGTAAGFPPDAEYDGLDARNSLPPLLRPGMLMDWESWWEFERLAVDCLADPTVPPGAALARLSAAAELARTWRPADGALFAHVQRSFLAARDVATNLAMGPETVAIRRAEVLRSIPRPHRSLGAGARRERGGADTPDRVMRRFLASHAFANWTIHLGQGLRTWLRSVEAAYALIVAGRNVRGADLLLRHLSDPKTLAEQWSDCE